MNPQLLEQPNSCSVDERNVRQVEGRTGSRRRVRATRRFSEAPLPSGPSSDLPPSRITSTFCCTASYFEAAAVKRLIISVVFCNAGWPGSRRGRGQTWPAGKSLRRCSRQTTRPKPRHARPVQRPFPNSRSPGARRRYGGRKGLDATAKYSSAVLRYVSLCRLSCTANRSTCPSSSSPISSSIAATSKFIGFRQWTVNLSICTTVSSFC